MDKRRGQVITVIVALLALPAQVGHDFRLPPSDVARAEVRAVEVTSDGSVWFGSSSGAGRLADGVWSFMDQESGLPHPVVHAVVVDLAGVAWFACRADGWEPLVLPAHLRGAEVFDLAEAPDGSIWIATSAGAVAYDRR